MNKILISILEQLVTRMKAAIEIEVEKREKALYECAMDVEKDKELQNEMKEWDITTSNGLADESW